MMTENACVNIYPIKRLGLKKNDGKSLSDVSLKIVKGEFELVCVVNLFFCGRNLASSCASLGGKTLFFVRVESLHAAFCS